jgi:hypothetical protein
VGSVGGSGSGSVAGVAGVFSANPASRRVSSRAVSVLPRIVTSTPATSTGTFRLAPGAQVV